MVSSNTETNITVTYQDVDGTIDFEVPDATSLVNGVVRLTGDLGGTAAAPIVTDDQHAHTGTSISALDAANDISTGVLAVARGGTGAAPGADDRVPVSGSSTTAAWTTLTDSNGANQCLQYDTTANAFSTLTITETGDISAVGDCTTGAAFGGACGSSQTWDNAGGDGIQLYENDGAGGLRFNFNRAVYLGTKGVQFFDDGVTDVDMLKLYALGYFSSPSAHLWYDASDFDLNIETSFGPINITALESSASVVIEGGSSAGIFLCLTNDCTTTIHKFNAGPLDASGTAGLTYGIVEHSALGAGSDYTRYLDGPGGTEIGEIRSNGTNLVWDWFQSGSSDVTLTHSSNLLEVAGGNLAAPFLIGSVTDDITACTTQTQGQCPLTSQYNRVTTVANTDDVVTLMDATKAGQVQEVHNPFVGNQIQVFPATGWNLGLQGYADNDPIFVSASTSLRCIAFDIPNKEWRCQLLN